MTKKQHQVTGVEFVKHFGPILDALRELGGSGTPGEVVDQADKGIILTTGTFTSDARTEASRDGVPPIELVDG